MAVCVPSELRSSIGESFLGAAGCEQRRSGKKGDTKDEIARSSTESPVSDRHVARAEDGPVQLRLLAVISGQLESTQVVFSSRAGLRFYVDKCSCVTGDSTSLA